VAAVVSSITQEQGESEDFRAISEDNARRYSPGNKASLISEPFELTDRVWNSRHSSIPELVGKLYLTPSQFES
jgi:hypothetical protein